MPRAHRTKPLASVSAATRSRTGRQAAGGARALLCVVGCLLVGCQTADRGTPAPADKTNAAAAKPLNVLFIMSDQHNAHALGCYGNEQIKTPSMDRLAQEGVRFENAFCQTGQCCPSRYTIWTGRYAHSHGLRWNHVLEPLDEITIGEVFKAAGYATATIGKHHMQYDLKYHGFDHVVSIPEYDAFIAAEGATHCWAEGDWIPIDTAKLAGPAGTSHADNDHHFAGFWANEAISYLRKNKDRPFCMWLSFHGPHVPFVASKPWMDLYDAKSLKLPPNFGDRRSNIPDTLKGLHALFENVGEDEFREILRCYYALTSQIDYNIGRVLDELDRLGLAERTVVVYTADHGEMMGEHGVFRKAVLNYDATARVPLIIRLPNAARTGVVVEELIGSVDLMPTLCELAGLEYPEKVQGRSLVPLLKGRPTEWRDTIFSEIGYPRPQFPLGLCTMARTRDHKYVHHDNNGKPMEELFDLRNDPWETVNQAANPEYAEVLARLRKAMQQWNDTTDHAPLYPIEPTFGRGLHP